MASKYKKKGPKYSVPNMAEAVHEAVNMKKRGLQVPCKDLKEKYILNCATKTIARRTQSKRRKIHVQNSSGRPLVLGRAVEARLARWIRDNWSVNLAPNKLQVIYKVKQLCNTPQCSFNHYGPSKQWLGNFLARIHAELHAEHALLPQCSHLPKTQVTHDGWHIEGGLGQVWDLPS